jgi:hypothetical protein
MARVTTPDDQGTFYIKFNEVMDFTDIDDTKLEIKVMRGEDYLTYEQDYYWKILNYTNRSLKIQITFENSQAVGTSDKVIVSFKDPFIAISGKPLRPKLVLT